MSHRLPPLVLLIFMPLIPLTPAAAELDQAGVVNADYLQTYAETRGFTLGRPIHPTPTPDGQAVLFLRAQPRIPKLELFEFDVKLGRTRLLLSPESLLKGAAEKLSAEERALRERMRVSVSGFADFQLSKDGQQILLSLSGKLYVVQRATGSIQELKTRPGPPLDPKFSPDGRKVAYVRDNDVYQYDLGSNLERALTVGGTDRLTHGLAEFVAREEMLRFSGYWWAPDSQSVAFQETDTSEVETWYVADPAQPGSPPYPAYYPRPGRANAKVRLGIVGINEPTPRWIQWDEVKFPYLASVTWDARGPLTVAVQTRDQKELRLLAVDDQNGRTATLLAENDSDWVDIRQDVPRWLAHDQGFLWAHEKSGAGWQLEWRMKDGALRRILVPSDFGFRSLVDNASESGDILFTARPDPTQWKLYRTSLVAGGIVELTPSAGCHTGQHDEEHSIYVDTVSTIQRMPRTSLYRRDGTPLGELPSVAEEPPLSPQLEIAQIGTEPTFYTALIRPNNFDPTQRYPVILHVYGGPLPDWSSGTVVQSMSAWLLPQWIAEQGFVVVSIDGRGTPGRGHDWERAIAKRFGTVPLEDLVSALKGLGGRHPELDLNRVGIYGWSFGGYLSALAVLKQPDLFKVAVAGAPPTDWLDYDTHYTERYLGTPTHDSAAYEEASLLHLAPQLHRPLLLVHGTGDDNVYFRHTLRLVDALFRAGKAFDVLPLSGLTHMVPDPVVNQQLYTRIIREFKQHLGAPRPRPNSVR